MGRVDAQTERLMRDAILNELNRSTAYMNQSLSEYFSNPPTSPDRRVRIPLRISYLIAHTLIRTISQSLTLISCTLYLVGDEGGDFISPPPNPAKSPFKLLMHTHYAYLLTYGIYTKCSFAQTVAYHLSEAIWSYLQVYGAIWSYLLLSGTIWSYLELSETIWSYLKLSGAIWSDLDLSGTTLELSGAARRSRIQTHEHTDTLTQTHAHTDTHRHIHTHTDTHTHTQTHKHRHTNTHRHTDTQTHRHTHTHTHTNTKQTRNT